jgi:hypothetical protein
MAAAWPGYPQYGTVKPTTYARPIRRPVRATEQQKLTGWILVDSRLSNQPRQPRAWPLAIGLLQRLRPVTQS